MSDEHISFRSDALIPKKPNLKRMGFGLNQDLLPVKVIYVTFLCSVHCITLFGQHKVFQRSMIQYFGYLPTTQGHFFLIFAAAAPVTPFLPILAKQLGISPFGVGIVFAGQKT